MRVVWLASWYPNQVDPFEGDFIQRHARAVSLYSPVTVFYVSQLGERHTIKQSRVIERVNEGVTEKIIFFHFARSSILFLDKLIYNWRYYNTYKKAIKKYFLKEGIPDLLHIHVPMKAGIIGRWIKRKWDIPYIISEHSSHYTIGSHDKFFGKSFFHRFSVKRIFKKAIVVINVSDSVAKILSRLFQLNDIRVIHNTVDTDLFYYRSCVISKFRFIHVSTLADPQKNIEGILAVVSQLAKQRNDFEIVIVGPASDELKERVRRLNLASIIIFTGEISYPEVAMEMQQSSVLVLFSRYENFPCVMIEALCCGLPVVASDTGGIKEAVNEENGVLVESENEKQLLEAMKRVMNEYDKYDRKKIAKEASQRYSYHAIGKKIYELYDEVLKTKAP